MKASGPLGPTEKSRLVKVGLWARFLRGLIFTERFSFDISVRDLSEQ